MQVDDSEQLHLLPLIADVKVQSPKNGYDASNTLRYLSLASGQQQPAAIAPKTPPHAASAPTMPKSGTAPWRRSS
jgi:hypothetical protein